VSGDVRVRSIWLGFGRVSLIVVLAGMIIFGVVLMRVSPDAVIGAAERVVQALREFGSSACCVRFLQALIVVSGIFPASLLGLRLARSTDLLPDLFWQPSAPWSVLCSLFF